MVNTRFQHTPAAVVYAHKTSDVQAAVKCAYNNEVRVSVQSFWRPV
jgi:FAD/FMN-containing dehydrogenase